MADSMPRIEWRALDHACTRAALRGMKQDKHSVAEAMERLTKIDEECSVLKAQLEIAEAAMRRTGAQS